MRSDIQNYSNLNYYKYSPVNTVSLADLESICKERLLLYGIFVEATQENLKSYTEKWKDFVHYKINNFQLQNYLTLCNNPREFKARRSDNLAHWMMSLCYCKNLELRKSFIRWELDWFMCRYNPINEKDTIEFFIDDSSRFVPLKIDEKQVLKDKLIQSISRINCENFDNTNYYKTKFANISMLVQQRQVYLDNGYAYFPETDLIYLALGELHSQFKKQLEWNVKMLPNVLKDDRVNKLFSDLPIITQNVTNIPGADIKLDDLPELSHYHFPLCMKHIHNILISSHHLKHDCRMQYGIFLKNLGLPYEDAMKFFEQEFTKGMSKDLFTRKYSYYFKHYYGKVGGKIDYKPYSCKFIQEMSPGPDQHHGCPFKHWDKEFLIGRLKNETTNIRDIEDLIDSKKYQHACTQYFGASRKIYRDTLIESPNHYCIESLNFEKNLDNFMQTVCSSL